MYYHARSKLKDLEMERGIFVGTVPNTVLQKLLHRSIYSTIDQNLGDSNVGGRKGKNIRSHSFIMNSVIHETVTTKAHPIAILDYKQAYDSMSLEVTMNDLYDIGLTDNKLNLINACDNEAKVAIKTPVGLTERVSVFKTVQQGDVNSTTKCTVTVNDVSEKHEENLENNIYKYLQNLGPSTSTWNG